LGLNKKAIEETYKHYKDEYQIRLNVEYETRKIVGDNEADMNDTIYGNNDLKAETSSHGTHVSGIIAAIRDNNLGGQGVADNVKIMALRVVPGGDEHDKDVALAIRYAVKMGAQIINCSFGKSYSPNPEYISQAIKFAEDNNVLIVHAAGNDNSNNDNKGNFPTDRDPVTSSRSNIWIEVGASNYELGRNIPAGFSNYGKTTVDVFAPGVEIYSCSPENQFESASGTSDASPVVAGIAALLLSYYPELTAVDLKKIIMQSAVYYGKQKVKIPGEKRKKTKFKNLSVTGGIVNAYQAVKMADGYKP
jgi:subtilisin family serine protease